MANIIALQGRGNCGKTTTLKLLIEKIIKKYSVSVQKQDWKKRHKDEVVILEIEIGGKNFKIGITTFGDPNSELQDNIRLFISLSCDLIYCGCRTRGMTVDWVNSFATAHKVQFVQKSIGTNHATLNDKQSDALMALGKI